MRKVLKLFFSFAIGCFGIGCVFAAAPFAGAATPVITVPETSYSFGELGETVPVSRDFTVKNTGSAVLNINDVRPS